MSLAFVGHATARTRDVLGLGSCVGTLGELFQGPMIRNGEREIAIVSLPFSKRSTCRYLAGPPDSLSGSLRERPKTMRAIELLCGRHGLSLPRGEFQFESELETGKGMASSTADIVAALRCVGSVLQRPFRAEEIMDVLRGVERSDSVFVDEAVLYLSERHEIVARFGRKLQFTAAYLVEPDVVDTEAARARLQEHYGRFAGEYRDALEQLMVAAGLGDAHGVARAATASARLSQRCFPKRHYTALRSALGSLGADGIFVAHTGSIVGYLYVQPPSAAQRDTLTNFLRGLGERAHIERVGWGDA